MVNNLSRIRSKIYRTANDLELVVPDNFRGYVDSKLSLFNFFRGDSSFDTPYVPSFRIKTNKDNDMLKTVLLSYSKCMLVSEKFHQIIMSSNYWSVHSYKTKVEYKGKELNYFILLFPNKIDVIDFSKTEVIYHPPLGNGEMDSKDNYKPVKFDNFIDFSERPDGIYKCYNLHLFKTEYDIFRSNLGASGGIYISDRLKKIIIENMCTGVEFY